MVPIAMVTALKSGEMAPNTSVNGNSIRHMARAPTGSSTVIRTKVSGSMIERTAMALTCMPMVQSMLVTGMKICNMALVSKSIQTVQDMKANTSRERSREKAHLNGKMDQAIPAIGLRTISMAKGSTSGLMAEFTQVNGT